MTTILTQGGTVSNNGTPLADKDITLRVTNSQGTTILVDQLRSNSTGEYSFGPYTLPSGTYQIYVGGAGDPQSKEFTISP